MALALLLVFRSRLRLLPLALALAAAALTFGLLRPVRRLADDGLDRRPADPDRPRRRLRDPVPGALRRGSVEAACAGVEAARAAAAAGGPTIATACLATARRLPRPPALADPDGPRLRLAARRRDRDRVRPRSDGWLRGPEPALRGGSGGSPGVALGCSTAACGCRRREPRAERRRRAPAPPPAPRPRTPRCRLAIAHPGRFLVIGLALAVIGWGVGTQIETRVGHSRAGAAGHAGGQDLNELQEATGVSGELDVRVEAPDLTDPATIEWMAGFKRRVLAANGFSGANPSCLEAEVCPGRRCRTSSSAVAEGPAAPRAGIRQRSRELPPYDLRAGGAGRSGDRAAGRHGADQLRDPGAVAGGPAGADRAGPWGDR